MNPLTKAEIKAILSQTVGSLKPYQLKQLMDALNRRPWQRGNPGPDPTSQATMDEIAATWTS